MECGGYGFPISPRLAVEDLAFQPERLRVGVRFRGGIFDHIQLELRQQPNNMNALVASQAVRSVIGRVGSSVEIARSSVAEAERRLRARLLLPGYFPDSIAWRSGFLDPGGQRGARFGRMKIHDVPYRALLPEKLDGLLMANALHFFKEKRELLERLRRYLKPGGAFLLGSLMPLRNVSVMKALAARNITAFSTDYHRHNDLSPNNEDLRWLRARTTVDVAQVPFSDLLRDLNSGAVTELAGATRPAVTPSTISFIR